MFFTINHDEASEGFQLIKKGDYEVIIISADYYPVSAENKTENVVICYEVRSDITQEHAGQKINYDRCFITDKAMWKVQTISKAVGFPHGMQISSAQEWANLLINKPLCLTVGHRKNDDGNVYPEAKGYATSKALTNMQQQGGMQQGGMQQQQQNNMQMNNMQQQQGGMQQPYMQQSNQNMGMNMQQQQQQQGGMQQNNMQQQNNMNYTHENQQHNGNGMGEQINANNGGNNSNDVPDWLK